MERLIERGLFASRWMMAPMYLGLALALVIPVWIFVMELWRFVLIVPVMTVNDAILGVLALIDLSLAANLLVIVAIPGIHLLKVFMDVGQYDPAQIRWMVIIHLVFVFSGVLLAAMDWIANHAKSLKYRKTVSWRLLAERIDLCRSDLPIRPADLL